ncbi:hypothetical protein [Chryseobacterium sp. BIGb0232]|uniref:hypothetical protein n=1 Tax=Chryseobacterium sp. BIGb0232 TaxID=2940598 RepID=UPI000FBBC85D|nr:hypothetical protein [Chryseobacterium sp. BIGb0232]MCS4305138.1 hypothetical protein [Chryseobacterium sp. BIGb0232]ROS07713.1 hypothetical protein EDF65_4817 [Chryseobacterium nakagawai]
MKIPRSFFFVLLFFFFCLCFQSCENKVKEKITNLAGFTKAQEPLKNVDTFDKNTKTIHVLVALCDNKYQGIVPVPEKIGNGQDPDQNLYWGAGYGVRTYFKKSKEWKLLKTEKKDSIRMERLIFQHTSKKNHYLVADAYDGQYIKNCTKDFLYSSSGQMKDILSINNTKIGLYGNAKLVSYIGHDGLMDFQLSESFKNTDKQTRDCIILACYSKRFFSPLLQETKANPLVWTSHLMAPEAYILHDALTGYLNNESGEQIRSRAALAYSKYQKCSVKAARNLLITGW